MKKRYISILTIMILVAIAVNNASGDDSLVLNLTFDNSTYCFTDYSALNHSFQIQGSVNCVNSTYGKWYGAANFTKSSGDYANTSIKFSLDNGIFIDFWVYETNVTPSQMFMQIGEGDGKLKYIQDTSTYGINPHLQALNGEATWSLGDDTTTQGVWVNYAVQYNTTWMKIWKNAEIISSGGGAFANLSKNYGNLNYTAGEQMKIGSGLYGINLNGYLDELLVYNRSNFTQDDVLSIYNEKAMGTPPTKDLYIKAIKYPLRNSTMNLTYPLPINITIANAGLSNTESAAWNLTLNNGTNLCSGTVAVTALNETNVSCTLTLAKNVYPTSFYSGYVTIDSNNAVAEDIETNNQQGFYLPYFDRPYMHFTMSDFWNTYGPYCANSSNTICYNQLSSVKSFVADRYNDAWSCNDADPRSKWGRSNAMSCLANNYSLSAIQCNYTIEYLNKFGAVPYTGCNNVQSMSMLGHYAMVYDYGLPLINYTNYTTVTLGFYNKAQYVATNQFYIQNYNQTAIIADNGKGFGDGLCMFIYSLIGENPDNPTMMQDLTDAYYHPSLVDQCFRIERSLLQGRKNDSNSHYQEGQHYDFYTYFNIGESLYFEKRYNLNNLTEYENAITAQGKEFLSMLLDCNYNGYTLRGDSNKMCRMESMGDSRSYYDLDTDSPVRWDILLYYGLLTNDTNLKGALLTMRNNMSQKGDDTGNNMDIYLYPALAAQTAKKTVESAMPKFMYDNSEDIFTIRSNYSYINDTIFIVDGGEEKGGGHSHAQGSFLYFNGEPFEDFTQTPYNDDVRPEIFKNGPSLQNYLNYAEGGYNGYSATCGNAPMNQYYGMSTCAVPNYPNDYPDYRQFPTAYGGDLEDYIGTGDTRFGGVYRWQPLKNANPSREYWIKIGNVIAKRTVITGNTQGNGIYDNHISLEKEFNFTISGTNYTQNRTNNATKINGYLAFQVINSSQSDLILAGGITNVNICFAKTDCNGGNKGTEKYRRMYLYTSGTSLDLVTSYEMYTGAYTNVQAINNNPDKGEIVGNDVIIFDTSNDGNTTYGNRTATAWGIAYNQDNREYGAFNASIMKEGSITLLSANDTGSFFLKRTNETITLTANTMKNRTGIDYPTKVRVSLDGQELANYSGLYLQDSNGINQTKVSQTGSVGVFDITPGQNSETYSLKSSSSAGGGETPVNVTYDQWYLEINDTINPGTYNITYIFANATDGSSNYSNPYTTFTVLSDPLPAVTNLVVQSKNNQSIYITWTEPIGEDINLVRILVNDTNYTIIPPGVQQYNVTNLNALESYKLTVRLIDSTNYEGFNASVYDTTDYYHSYSITVYNFYNMSSVQDFTASFTDGNHSDVTTGSYRRVTEASSEDITISGNNIIDKTITTHNTDQNIQINITDNTTRYLRINAYDTDGLIASPTMWTNVTGKEFEQNANPFLEDLKLYINETTPVLNITIYATDAYHQNISSNVTVNRTQYEYNLTMDQNQLILRFPSETTGVIKDTNKAYNFTNTSFVMVQSSLALGRVDVIFNMVAGVNHTQFYEFNNEAGTNIDQTFSLLTLKDTLMWVKVIDLGSNPIEDASIYMYHAVANDTGSDYAMIGKRLTDSDGYTFFWLDSTSQANMIIMKTGYATKELLITPADNIYTSQSAAKTVTMEASQSAYDSNAVIVVQDEYDENTTSISGFIYAPELFSLKINTNYRITNSLPNITLTKDGFDIYRFTLKNNYDYQTTQMSDIILYAYVNGNDYSYYVANKTIRYTSPEIVNITEPEAVDNNIKAALAFIGLIAAATLIGLKIRSPTAGANIFMAGCILLPLVSIEFISLMFISMLYFLIKGLYKTIRE